MEPVTDYEALDFFRNDDLLVDPYPYSVSYTHLTLPTIYSV